MSIRRFFIAIVCAIFLTACEKPLITYEYVYDLIFENNSSYDIVISRDGFDNTRPYEHPEIAIKASESIIITNGYAQTGLFGKKCIVNFGNKVAVDYSNLPKCQYHLLFADNYEVVSSKNGWTRFKYTFTDADYQFALEHGTVLE